MEARRAFRMRVAMRPFASGRSSLHAMARPVVSLSGKTALITGAGRGIGAETARQLDRRGARLALLDINGAEVEALASGLREAIAIQADVTDEQSMQSAVANAVERFGGIDIAMANAGVAFPGLL